MSWGSGAGGAVSGWVSMAGSLMSMAARSHPSRRGRNSVVVIAAIGVGVVEDEARSAGRVVRGRWAGRRPRFSARPGSPRPPGLSAASAAPHAVPGARRGRSAGGPTGLRPRRVAGRSGTAARRSARPRPGWPRPGWRTPPGSRPPPAPGAVSTARLPHPSRRAWSAASSTSMRRQRSRWGRWSWPPAAR